jgi:hypothetical protein
MIKRGTILSSTTNNSTTTYYSNSSNNNKMNSITNNNIPSTATTTTTSSSPNNSPSTTTLSNTSNTKISPTQLHQQPINDLDPDDMDEYDYEDDDDHQHGEKRSDIETNDGDEDNEQGEDETLYNNNQQKSTTTSTPHLLVMHPRSKLSKCLIRFLPRGGYRSLVERLPPSTFYRDTIEAPQYLLRWFILIHSIFLLGWTISFLIASVVTWYVVYVLYALIIWGIIITISRSIVYPAGNSFMARKTEFALAEEVSRRYEEFTELCMALQGSSPTVAPNNNNNSNNHDAMVKRKLDQLEHFWTTFLEPTSISLETFHLQSTSRNSKTRDERDIFITALNRFKDAHKQYQAQPNDMLVQQELGLAAQSLRPLIRPALMGTIPVDPLLSTGAPFKINITSSSTTTTTSSTNSTTSSYHRNPNNVLKLRWMLVTRTIKAYLSTLQQFPGLGSYSWLRTHLQVIKKGQPNNIGYYVNGMFMPATTTTTSTVSPRTIILSSGNASIYETAALFDGWCDFYTQHGINVYLYNYRGYVASRGFCSPSTQRADMKAIIQHLKTNRAEQCQYLGCHGESIGGVPSCYGATLDAISLLICDRTFSSLRDVATCFVGKSAADVLHFITRWKAENINNFMTSKCDVGYKILLQDPEDHIVQHCASLKIGVALAYFKNIVGTEATTTTSSSSAKVDIENNTTTTTSSGNTTTPDSLLQLAEFINNNVKVSEFVHAAHACLVSVSRSSMGAAIEGYHIPDPYHAEKLNIISFPASSDIELMREMIEFARVVLNTDAGHGQIFGKALNEDIQHRFEDANPRFRFKFKWGNNNNSSSSPSLKPKIPPRAVQGWFASSKVYYVPIPSMVTRLHTTTNEQLLTTSWSLMNESGIYSASKGIPLLVSVRVMKKFIEAREERLHSAGLDLFVKEIVSRFSILAEAALIPNSIHLNKICGKLIPLKCGHNGMPSNNEIKQFEEFLRKAGWIQ